jgi:hypothetical protein
MQLFIGFYMPPKGIGPRALSDRFLQIVSATLRDNFAVACLADSKYIVLCRWRVTFQFQTARPMLFQTQCDSIHSRTNTFLPIGIFSSLSSLAISNQTVTKVKRGMKRETVLRLAVACFHLLQLWGMDETTLRASMHINT